jgi:phosphonate transport system substrate-binding protein
MNKRTAAILFSVLIVVSLALAACGPGKLGTEKNPLVWSFVPSGEMERVAAGAGSVAAIIEEETGLIIETNVATEYAGVIEAMCSDPVKAHIGSLATFAYVLAHERGCANAVLVSVRFGSPSYNGQIIVRADSGITDLSQLAGKVFCRPDPLSTSGWIIPQLDLLAAGVNPDTDLQVLDAGSHDAVVAAVYNGECDAGATYVDARTNLQEEHPDVLEVLEVIATSVDIPNDGVQFVPGLDQDIQDQIVTSLVNMLDTEEGLQALDTAYQWTGLQKIDDSFYDPFRQLLDAAGMNIESLQ